MKKMGFPFTPAYITIIFFCPKDNNRHADLYYKFIHVHISFFILNLGGNLPEKFVVTFAICLYFLVFIA